MHTQKPLKLALARLSGEPAYLHADRQRELNHGVPCAVSREKLLAQFLKRQARQIMADVTECPPETLPAHLARLDGLRELVELACRHEFIPGNETLLSGKQLQYPSTVQDFFACLMLTRTSHRAPSYMNERDKDIAEINRKLDLLAGLFSNSRALNAVLQEEAA